MDHSDNFRWIKTLNNSVFVKETATPRAVVGATCVLSMAGSILIVLSYLLFKQLRTRARLILVHLSLMDFGVALANFIGAVVYFDRYYYKSQTVSSYHLPKSVSVSCVAQAVVAITSSNSSVFWTVAVAVYLHFKIVTHAGADDRLFKYLMYFFYIFNYGLPILLSIWLLRTERLGFAPYDSSGWCSIIVKRGDEERIDNVAGIVGYDLWIYIAILIIPALYISVKVHAKRQYEAVSIDSRSKSQLQFVDHKFTAIPLIFLGLRIWSVIISVVLEYLHVDEQHIPALVGHIFIYLSGIGDSAQGAANGILFVVLTRKARQLLLDKCCPCCCKKPLDLENSDESLPVFSSPEQSVISSVSGSNSPHKYQSDGRTLILIQNN